MSAASATESRELDLVGKVEMRIALAKDEKLESVLKTYLAPLLLKLASEHISVRNKVVSTCQHIKVRLSGNQAVILPVAALLKQYKENADSSMIRHFDLMFIQQSIGKLSSKEQIDLLPTLTHGLSADATKPTCATIFNLFLRVLPQLRFPPRASKEDVELRKTLGFDSHVEDTKFVSSWLGKLLLLMLVRATVAEGNGTRPPPPGLTIEDFNFLTLNGKRETWDSSAPEGLNLTETKIIALSFLSSGAFADLERFLPAIFASADTNSRISSVGDDLLKRSTVSLEDRDLVRQMFEIYFTARPALRTKILLLLCRSSISATFPKQIVRLVQEGIKPPPEEAARVPMTGLEALKFRNAMFNYINWVSRVGSQNDLRKVAPSLVSLLRSFIEDQNWSTSQEKTPDATSQRGLAYETLGLMAKTTPSISVEPTLSLVRWLFKSLTVEGSTDNLFISIDGALSSLISAFAAPLDIEIVDALRRLLLHYMNLDEGEEIVRSGRAAALRWANRCLKYDDIVARWIDILAFQGPSNERSDVLEEGKKGLDPYWYKILNASGQSTPSELPEWAEMVKTLFSGHVILEESAIANSTRTGMEVDGISVFGNFPGTKINAFAPAVSYCRRMLLLGATQRSETPISIDADWERQLDVLYRTDKSARKTVKNYIKTFDKDAVALFLTASFEGILRNDGNGLEDCSRSFLEVAALSPIECIEQLASRARELLPAIKSNKVATRFIAAQAFGLLSSHPSNDSASLQQLVASLLDDIKYWPEAVGGEVNRVHGAIVALGYCLSRSAFYGRSQDDQETNLRSAVKVVLDILCNARDASLIEASLSAITQFGSASLLTEPNVAEFATISMDELIEKLTTMAKKADEKAISALGRASLAMQDEGNFKKILDSLYALSDLRQAETQFTVGEALSCAAARWQSDCLTLNLDVDAAYDGPSMRSEVLKEMMDKLLIDCKTTKPSLKKASGIWLFCLIQYSGHLEEVQSRLRECQAAFMGLLTARDDLVQETASRGLSLVYEQGSKELKERLVNDLVASFTGTSAKLKVDEDTELFEPGALPTGEGQSVTSYKDIMSLAAEVGDQTLVYKFMSLASNAATWSTRAAFGRFGLSNILSESEVDPKLYPKLYRYRFDPNPNVRRSMNDIWSALVKDPSTTIDKYFDSIMDDLLKNILGKEWRTREASCSAIADLVQGRQFEKYEKYLSQIWGVAFKVLDDIKGSVREAAMKLCKTLTGILVRQVEQGTSSKNAQAMLKEVIPFLLSTQGLESSAKDVQYFALDTVLKLVKSGGKTMLPFVPTLVEQMLGLLSTLEAAEINYLHINAANYNTTEEEIDSARSTMVSRSPMMDAIERCLDLLDEPTMKELAPNIENVIKTAIGMPSKVGCSAILVSLSTRHSFIFRPHADTFCRVAEKATLDRNSTVSAAYARAMGYVARLASDKALLRLATYSKKLYLGAEDESHRQVSADLTYAVSKYATDRFNALSSDFLPFAFFAKHDFDDHVKKQFENTWSENVGGSRAVLLYLKEISDLALEQLESPRWTIKHTAALTISDAAISAGVEIDMTKAEILWPALEKALSLKTFDGKEKVLEAFVAYTKAAMTFWKNDKQNAAQMTKIAVREAKRNNEAYRPFAFRSLGEYCAIRTDIDNFDTVYEIVVPLLEELTDKDKMDTKDGEKADKGPGSTIVAGVDAILRAINTMNTEPSPITHMAKLPAILKSILSSPQSDISTKVAFYERVKALFDGLGHSKQKYAKNSWKVASEYLDLLELTGGAGNEALRLKRAEAAEAICSTAKTGHFDADDITERQFMDSLRMQVKTALEIERAPSVKNLLKSKILEAMDE